VVQGSPAAKSGPTARVTMRVVKLAVVPPTVKTSQV
jgi:hypothetical protein